jgi:hypothetical protein
MNNVFMPKKTLNRTRIKLNKTIPLPAPLCCSENWTVGARDEGKITAAEMKFTRKTAVYTWRDYKTNTEIAKELNIIPDLDEMQDYRSNWTRRVFLRITQDNRKLPTKRQKFPGKASEEVFGLVRPERVNKWQNSMMST